MTDRPPEIEFLDATTTTAATHIVAPTPSPGDAPSRSVGLGIAAVLIVGVGLAALAADRGVEQAPITTAPPTTVRRPALTTPTDEAATTTTLGTGATIGDGLELSWLELAEEPGSSDFHWIDDAFISSDGESEWVIRPDDEGVQFEARPSPLPDRVGRQRVAAVGGLAWLAPDNSIEVVIGDGVVTIPRDVIVQPETSLGDSVVWHRVAVDGSRILIVDTVSFVVDRDALLARLDLQPPGFELFGFDLDQEALNLFGQNGETRFALDDTDFTVDEIALLRLVGDPANFADLFDLTTEEVSTVPLASGPINSVDVIDGWFVISALSATQRSADALAWSVTELPSGVGLSSGTPGPDGGLYGSTYIVGMPNIARSLDRGISWSMTPEPFRSPVAQAGSRHVVVSVGWALDLFELDRWSVSEGGYELTISTGFDSFELSDQNGVALAAGDASEPGSGFRFWPQELGYRFVDPITGIEVMNLDELDMLRGFAAAKARRGEPTLVGIADWPEDSDDPVWKLQTVGEMFGPEALSASFVSAPEHLLAIVETELGRRYFVAAAP